MTDFSQGVDAINRLVNMINPLQDIAAALTRIGSVESANDQAVAASAKAAADLAAINAELEGAKGKLDEENAVFNAMLVDHNEKRIALLNQADVDAKAIVAEARDIASQMIADASSRILTDSETADARFFDASHQLEIAKKAYTDQVDATTAIVAQADAAQAQLDGVKAQLTKMIG